MYGSRFACSRWLFGVLLVVIASVFWTITNSTAAGIAPPTVSIPPVQAPSYAIAGAITPWQLVTPFTTTRDWPEAVQHNGHIYVLGGGVPYFSAGQMGTVEWTTIQSDGSLGVWNTTTPMIIGKSTFGVATYGSHLYALGGWGQSGLLSDVERAAISDDGTLGQWQTLAPLPEATSGLVALASRNYLYIIGGFTGSRTSRVERAAIGTDGSLGPWQDVTPMSTPRCCHAAVVVGGYIYAIGGQNDSPNGVSLRSVERAAINPDGTLGAWYPVNSLTVPRCDLAAVALGEYIYAIGGGNCTGTSYSSVERARVDTLGNLGYWEMVTPMTISRSQPSAVQAGGYIFAIGGTELWNPGYSVLTSVERTAELRHVFLPQAERN